MSKHRNQRGSTLIAAISGIAIVSILSIAYADMYSSARKLQQRVDLLNTITQIQMNMTNTANDAKSWAASLNDSRHNPSMSCLAKDQCAAAITPTAFVLWPASVTNYEHVSNAVYDGTNASAGFTLNGQPCSTFSTSGNKDCPLHVNLKWSTPGCTPTPCQPVVTVTADILFRPGTKSSFSSVNENDLKLSFVQTSVGSPFPCSGAIPADEATLCASPPYPEDRLYCTPNGFRCGRVFY